MSVKEIKEAHGVGKVLFGIKQALRNKKDVRGVFIAKDARNATVEQLDSADIEFTVLKKKDDIAKELNLSFTSEVFSIVA